MDMVEKAARAMAWSDLLQAETEESLSRYGIVYDEISVDENYMRLSRAAIEAMREPTEAMIDAGYDVGYSPDPLPTDEVWRAMINAALVPSPPLGEE